MTTSNFLKGKSLYLFVIFFLILFSCTSGVEKSSDQDISQDDFQTPKLIQQELINKISGDPEEYALYNSIMAEGPLIPGIFQSAVPQGMAYYEEADLMLISNYMFDGRPSCITAVKMSDGLIKKTL